MSSHIWVTPPPGTGSRRNPICKRCGIRSSAATPDIECGGPDRSTVIETTHDYDPIHEAGPDPEAERRAANAKVKAERRRTRR